MILKRSQNEVDISHSDEWNNIVDDKFKENLVDRINIGIELVPVIFPSNTYLSIYLTNDKEMHQLNLEHRKIDKPTNVLSFSYRKDGEFVKEISNHLHEMPFLLGDIVLSYETVYNEYLQYGNILYENNALVENSFYHYTEYLIIHGFLHLCDYHHYTENEERIMNDLSNRIRH